MKKVAVLLVLSLVFVSMVQSLSLAEPTGAVIIDRVKKPDTDGGSRETTKITVEPSESGAWAGAATGAAVGTYLGGPVGAVVGGSIGAFVGWIFGPAD